VVLMIDWIAPFARRGSANQFQIMLAAVAAALQLAVTSSHCSTHWHLLSFLA
jgi:hypothetical protein